MRGRKRQLIRPCTVPESCSSLEICSGQLVANGGRVAGLGHSGDLIAISFHETDVSRHHLSYQG